MQILGYTPYHMAECVYGGAKSMRILNEGMIADQDPNQTKFKKYDAADFRKWFSNYDVRPMPTHDGAQCQAGTGYGTANRTPSALSKCAASSKVPPFPARTSTIRTSSLS